MELEQNNKQALPGAHFAVVQRPQSNSHHHVGMIICLLHEAHRNGLQGCEVGVSQSSRLTYTPQNTTIPYCWTRPKEGTPSFINPQRTRDVLESAVAFLLPCQYFESAGIALTAAICDTCMCLFKLFKPSHSQKKLNFH